MFFIPFGIICFVHPFSSAKEEGQPLSLVKEMKPDNYSMQDAGNENTPIIWAIANANNAIANEMIQRGPKKKSGEEFWLDLQCNRGNSPLHLAVGKGYKEISRDGQKLTVSNYALVEAMLKKGANPNLANAKGNTPLHLACTRRDAPMIALLLSYGALPNIGNREGRTPGELLHLSFEEAHALLNKTVFVFLLEEREFESASCEYTPQMTCVENSKDKD